MVLMKKAPITTVTNRTEYGQNAKKVVLIP